MSEVKEKTKEDVLQSLNELEQIVKIKLAALNSNTPITLEKKLIDLEKKFQLVNERNEKVYAILTQVISELESLLTNEDSKCQQ